MANVKAKADVVIVGLGWAGSLMAEELTRAGLNVVAIERGKWRDTSSDFPPSIDTDELRFSVRREILAPASLESYTVRNNSIQEALPARDFSTSNFTFGNNVGGAGTHWSAAFWRFNPWDFEIETRVKERYGKAQFVDGLIAQDWGISYDELEPYYDRFEKIGGVSGIAGNVNGQKKLGGNPFEGTRQSEYPTPPLVRSPWCQIFIDTSQTMGYNPFPVPAGIVTQGYVNPLGVHLAPCTYCGYCMFYGCGNWSKSSPNSCVVPALMTRRNFSLMTETEVLHVNKSGDGKTATGVTYIDSEGNQGEQLADIVVLTAYQLDNVRLLLLSGIGRPYDYQTGEGVVGRAYSYQTLSYAYLFFKDENFNPFISAGALATQIDDFNADNFDHSGLGFIGGAGIQALAGNNWGLPIGRAGTLPPGEKRWGSSWKKSYQHAYQNYAMMQGQGTSYSHREQYLDLDPTYKDSYGRPLLRMTYDYNLNDQRSGKFIQNKCHEIAQACSGVDVVQSVSFADKHYSPFTPNNSSHTIGGAVMGKDPKTSVLNRYQQVWDMHNVFVCGASSFPNNGGFNPTGTLGALTLWTAKAIIEKYVQNPSALVKV